MDLFIRSFIIGFMGFLAYKAGVIWEIDYEKAYMNLISKWVSFLGEDEIFQLATINLTRAEESEEGYKEVTQQLYGAFKKVGFAYVTDLKGFDPDELLYWTKWLFDLPKETKDRITKKAFNRQNPNVYRGLYPSIPGGHSHKEAFEQGTFERDIVGREYPKSEDLTNQTKKNGRLYTRNVLKEKNVWPITGDAESDEKFREVMIRYYKLYYRTSLLIMGMLASGLGFDKNKFDYLFCDQTLSTQRLIHYPSRLHNPETIPDEAWDGDKAIVTGEHFDSGILTVLATFENSGLQIKPHGFPKWIDVPAVKDRLVINIGNLLSEIAEGQIVATNHRVLDIGVSRYSAPFFMEPCYDSDISKTIFGNEVKSVGKFKKYGSYMTNRTRMFAEYKTIDWGYTD